MTPARNGQQIQLTPNERAALAASARGLIVTEVAAELGQPAEVVRASLVSAISRLGARSKLEAVIIALRHGLIAPPD